MGRRTRRRIPAPPAGRRAEGQGSGAARKDAAASGRPGSGPAGSAAPADADRRTRPAPGDRLFSRAGKHARRPAPRAPWAPFPLIELAVLVAIVLVAAGLLTHGSRGLVLLGCGLGLVTLATLELTVREHFAGYRSHASLLAGAGAVAAAAALYSFTRLPQPAPLALAAAVFAALWSLLRAAHRRAQAPPG